MHIEGIGAVKQWPQGMYTIKKGRGEGVFMVYTIMQSFPEISLYIIVIGIFNEH